MEIPFKYQTLGRFERSYEKEYLQYFASTE